MWSDAQLGLGSEALRVVAELLWVMAGVAWLWLVVAHVLRGRQSGKRLITQLKHPVQGPFAALVPVTAMLLGAHIHAWAPAVGVVIVVAGMIVAVVFAAWMAIFWLRERPGLHAVHGGYLLPITAVGLVGAVAAARVGWVGLAVGALSFGVVSWIVTLLLLVVRLWRRPPLPTALRPTLAILLAPPALIGIAWFSLVGTQISVVSIAILAMTIAMFCVQLALLGHYRAVPFSLGFWSFTFPLAATGSWGIEWLSSVTVPGWQLGVVAIVAGITLLILGIAAKSMVHQRHVTIDRKIHLG